MNLLSSHSTGNSNPVSLSIARSAFQFILHHALQAGKQKESWGLLGSKALNLRHIDSIACLPEKSAGQTLPHWLGDDVICAGIFYLQGEAVSETMLACVPDDYVELAVCLDEKGRLDLFAFQCVRGSDEKIPCTVTMIEDGQALADG